MNDKKNTVLGTLGFIVGAAFILVFIIGFIFAIIRCDNEYIEYRNSLPAYHVSYGTFVNGRANYDFETYIVDGNKYTFYDKSGNVVIDIIVSGNNVLNIFKNYK